LGSTGEGSLVNISRKLVIGNAIFDAGGLLLVQLITFFILPLFIKNLGPELYGVWVLSGILLGYLDFFDFGLTAGLQKYIAEARAKKDHQALCETVSSALGFLAFVGCLCGLAIIVFREPLVVLFKVSPQHAKDAEWLLLLTGLGSILQWPLRTGPVTLSATLHIKQLSVARTTNGILSSVVMLGMVAFWPHIIWIRAATLALQISYQMRTLIMAGRLVPELKIGLSFFRWSRIRSMFSFSLDMFVFQVLGMLAVQVQPLLMGILMAPAATAHYAIATKLFSVISRFTSTLNQTVLPTAFNLHAQGDKERLHKLVERGVRYRMLLVAPAGVGCLVLSGPFLRLWVGDEYLFLAPYSSLLGIMILASPLAVALHVARAAGNIPAVNWLFAFDVVVSLVLMFLGLPWFGVGSAVLGFVIAHVIFGSLLFFPIYCRLIGIGSRDIFVQFFRQFVVAGLFSVAGAGLVQIWSIRTWWELSACAALLAGSHYLCLLKFFVYETERYDLRVAAEQVGLGRWWKVIDDLLNRKR
jgi:O-antigen/teichoic acid export membrane protein